MNINKIKNELELLKGKVIKLKYNLGRNKIEIYDVIIEELYKNVFIVKIKDKDEIKCFTYNDIITKTIKLM